MMFFQDGRFPKLGAYFREELTTLSSTNLHAYLAFLACCGSGTLAKKALTPGCYPLIVILDYQLPQPGVFDDCPPGDRVNMIFLRMSGVESYETDPQFNKQILERNTLHEMVHWGRHHAGADAEIDGYEAGTYFEALAGYPGGKPDHHSGIACPERGRFHYSRLFPKT